MPYLPLPSSLASYKRVAGTNPAANNEVTDTVPTTTNEVQTISGTPSATFALTVDGITGPTTLTTTATAQNIQDYLNAFAIYAPNGVVCSAGPLPSSVTITYSGAPAAGRNVSAPTVAGGVTGLTITTTTQGAAAKSWFLYAVSVSLVQGATQTPWPSLVIDDGSNIIYQAFSGTAAQSAATTTQHSWGIGVPATGSAASTSNTGPLGGEMILPAGFRIRTITTGIGANSDYGVPSYFVCELG